MTADPSSSNGKTKSESSLWKALQLAWELGYLIALPAVLFGFGGAWLDKSAGTMPLFTLLGFAIAVTISAIAIKRRIRTILL